MLKKIIIALAAVGTISCAQQQAFDPASIKDSTDEIAHVEPLSWWVGMKTPSAAYGSWTGNLRI